jgi:putative flippase GtrA
MLLARYLFVGGIATVVDVGVFSLFSEVFSVDYRIAIIIGFSFGVVTNFALCNWVVFIGKRKPLWLVFVRHYVSSLSVLATNEVMMISLVELFNFKNLVPAKIMSSGVAFAFNFLIKKFYVYNDSYYKSSIYKKSMTNESLSSMTKRRSRR